MILDDNTMMFAHHERKMRSEAIPIFQQAVNEDLELCTEAQTKITVVVHTMC